MGRKHATGDQLPFRSAADFGLLAEKWKEAASGDGPGASGARAVLDAVAGTPLAGGSVTDRAVLEEHARILPALLSLVVPPGATETAMYAVCAPFSYDFFYMSPAFCTAMQDGEIVNEDSKTGYKIAYGYMKILKHLYGMQVPGARPMIVETGSAGGARNRFFRMLANESYVTVECEGKLPALSDADREHIMGNVLDTDFLMKKLPPDKFLFRGLIFLEAVEVTEETRLSRVKQLILQRGSILSRDKFLAIQDQLRALVGSDDVFLTVSALRDNTVLMLNKGVDHGRECIYGGTEHYPVGDFAGTIFMECVTENRIKIIPDLKKKDNPLPIEKHLVEHGKRNLLSAPLEYEGKMIGVLGLGSPNPGTLCSLNTLFLSDLLPVFAHALERSLDEFEDRVQHVVQERFTSLHPSVEWRFRQEAVRLIELTGSGAPAVDEPIVFDNVYPLYSVTDIRGSSVHRNRAIREDLVDHLTLARRILSEAYTSGRLPIFDEIIFRIDGFLESIRESLSTGDELAVINFLRTDVETSFSDIRTYSPEIASEVDEYFRQIDPRTGTVYRRRREYDTSVSRINAEISAYLERVNGEAQVMFPHYFDKQATDGVDQNIYLGESLSRERSFNPIYLKNMRLWQLIVMCEIAHRMERLKSALPVPLDTTHLIMVQDMPISIRFDLDEKKFRVDGAYNIRYEIMKKRIDKAVIKGTGERLTQPGKIAIVYSHTGEITEYRQYVAYLQSKGLLLNDPHSAEMLDLEDLQGIKGLQAMRVALDPEYMSSDKDSVREMIGEAIPG